MSDYASFNDRAAYACLAFLSGRKLLDMMGIGTDDRVAALVVGP